jgi:mycofactocin precursor
VPQYVTISLTEAPPARSALAPRTNRRRSTVSSDTSQARSSAVDTAQDAGKTSGSGDIEATEELLIEEISIDGMCGVY